MKNKRDNALLIKDYVFNHFIEDLNMIKDWSIHDGSLNVLVKGLKYKSLLFNLLYTI